MSAVAQTSPPQCDKSFGLPLTLSPSAQFSYLAAQPSDEDVYTLYGHAGLRVCDSVQGFDVTFNYGLFNFSEDFVPRFIQGKTDYIVLPIPTSDYMSEYQGRGVIYELILRTDSLQRAISGSYSSKTYSQSTAPIATMPSVITVVHVHWHYTSPH